MIAADGHAIGEVAALFVDTSAWTVVALKIKLNKVAAEQLGAARGLLRSATLDLPIRMVQSAKDAVLLNIPMLELRQVFPEAGGNEEKT